MRKDNLKNLLGQVNENKDVVVYFEGFYYPISEIKETKEAIIITCKDIKKVEEI